MFFILKGCVSLVSPDFYVIRSYIAGSYFGEIEILSKPVCCYNNKLIGIPRLFSSSIRRLRTAKTEEIRFVKDAESVSGSRRGDDRCYESEITQE